MYKSPKSEDNCSKISTFNNWHFFYTKSEYIWKFPELTLTLPYTIHYNKMTCLALISDLTYLHFNYYNQINDYSNMYINWQSSRFFQNLQQFRLGFILTLLFALNCFLKRYKLALGALDKDLTLGFLLYPLTSLLKIRRCFKNASKFQCHCLNKLICIFFKGVSFFLWHLRVFRSGNKIAVDVGIIKHILCT